MPKYFLLFILSLSFGQAPFSKDNPKNTLAIKGIGYINLLDGGFGSIVGIEKGFLKNHSIGGKFIYNHFTPHRENTSDGSYDAIDYVADIDKSFIIEYKYYLNLNFTEIAGFSFYGSLNYKRGKRTKEFDRNYHHDFYFQSVKYNYFGPALGILWRVDKYSRWTIDTQLGYLFGKKNTATNYEVFNQYLVDDTYSTNYLRFEVLVAYNFDL